MDPWIMTSAVVASQAAVSSDQPIATSIGINILKKGGNAADAAVATMAAVSVIQPMTCGIGGDCHSLFYRHSDQNVFSLNGSGRTGENATLQNLLSAGVVSTTQKEFSNHGFWVSVPGAVAGMCNLVKNFGSGKLTMSQILEPATKLAEEGVSIPPKTSYAWHKFKIKLKGSYQSEDVLYKGEAPLPGEKIYAHKLAQTFKIIGLHGSNGFYKGQIAENIVKEVRRAGGVLTLNDMEDYMNYKSANELTDAISVDFHGFRIWEMRPNTIGLVALVALNILKLFDLKSLGHNSSEYIHIVAEVIKCSFRECWDYLCDPDYSNEDFKFLLSEECGRKLKMKIDTKRPCNGEHIISGGNTSYVAVVDSEGNGCSFICSISSDFGTGIIPEDCGFVLHDRLKCMSLDENSPNAYGPKKFPLHSIMPAMVTDVETNELLALLGVCGRWMQPQGQIQLLLNMVIFGMDPQVAVNQPRFFVGNCRCLMDYRETLSMLNLEDGIPLSVIPSLKAKGHEVEHSINGFFRIRFGKGHIIAQPALWNINAKNSQKSWWAAVDPRTDGSALGF